MSIGRAALHAGLAAIVLMPVAVTGEAFAFDFARYRPTTIRAAIKDLPAQPGVLVTTDLPIRARVTFAGEFRDLPDDSRRLIAAWAEAMNVPVAPGVFPQELRVSEAGTDYWVPVQEVLVPAMRAELQTGEEIELYMIYIGQIDGRHLFLVNAFDHDGPHRERP